ncbi:MAG TPA: hypothetical protein VH912_18670 [Streptosporangiaceae bacterium]|jgi:hypothetical protein
MLKTAAMLTMALVAVASAGACGGSGHRPSGERTSPSTRPAAAPHPLPQSSENVPLDPANFTTAIDNPYWPMQPGSRWVYREGKGRDEVTVLNETKTVAGIQSRIVHDVLTEGGAVKEDTYDWYAQDRDGNIWYMGEATKEFHKGKPPNTEGSWEAGVHGAQPGVIMPARPTPGLLYRQEYYRGQAEDAGQILALDEHVRVPYGSFDHTLKTKDYSPLEPNVIEQKYYAPGVGPVLAVTVSGGSDKEELLSYTKGG